MNYSTNLDPWLNSVKVIRFCYLCFLVRRIVFGINISVVPTDIRPTKRVPAKVVFMTGISDESSLSNTL